MSAAASAKIDPSGAVTTLNRRRRWFCHYFESGDKGWSDEAGKRIAREAAGLRNTDGSACFDEILTYRQRDLGEAWVAARSGHFGEKRGAGLWVWKPRAIRLTLDKMADGDELLYCDTGCELKGSVEPLFQLLGQQDIVPLELDIHLEREWTKGDAFDFLDARAHADTKQRVGGISIWKKTTLAYKLLDMWSSYCDQLHLLNAAPSRAPNLPGFREHRHDQSGWSLATKKLGLAAIPDITWPPHRATIIAASRRQS
jgi:hypothetical protein